MSGISSIIIIIALLIVGCASNNLSGVYVCDKSGKKNDTTIKNEGYNEIVMDYTCRFTQLDFKGNNTVVIGTAGGEVISSYVIAKEYVRIKGTGSDILLEIHNERTLSGEGIAMGTYHKN